MSFNDYNKQKIDELLDYLNMRIDQAEREERRFYDAGQMSSGYLWEGTKSGFIDAKIAVLQILLNQDAQEVEQ